ncbi:BREX-2 system phosphatase PglZ [Actinoallomurus rhizosphaericola]|uniref:BREX-2 system phosphatase PglZ n=1 Tax=Actinoallomurus rhizosphaericola TaxID=2952536 RepID=UPI002090A984|nr:BREX-2 system phosphatase PglZ [Actinoallomurus rhizosphaericola]MCO5994770.1 BREX-2 system phosphatase PglZ [Actinoallomurus rhizosphaericola]
MSGSDDPAVEIALIGVDTHAILQQVLHVDDDAAKRRLLKSLLWEEFGVPETNQFVTSRSVIWKGTERTVELVFANVRDPEVAEALLDAQPAGGWRRLGGPVLQLETALGRLAAVRLGMDGEDDRVDAAALLEWSRDALRVTRFAALREEERTGLAGWLEDTVGPVARVVFRLLGQDQAADAVPFGLAAAELYAPEVSRRQVVVQARVRVEERFFGGRPPSDADLRTFAEAAGSLTLRWSDNGRAEEAQELCERAEHILGLLRADDLAGMSRVLDAGLDARLARLGTELSSALPLPRPNDLPAIHAALDGVLEHRRSGDRADEVETAKAAVRLVRWLARGESPPATVADGAFRYLRSWSWVDRAIALIWNADTARVPSARAAYAALYDAAREQRATLDRAFAERLAAWSEVSGTTDELLLAENLLARIARPIAERAVPLIIVLDGMSAANASELGGQIAAQRGWTEVGRAPDGREPALATVPSTTRYSRTSLLCGALRSGGQSDERAGFTAFWRGRRTALFHKAGLGTGAGARLSDEVTAAILDPGTVVAVVLNTIDDALCDGREGSAPNWRLEHVAYLPELLKAAASAGRPVILTSDHGHVLDRGEDLHPATGDSARHRTGAPGDGELTIRGPRVLAPGGEVVVPWDERIRYQPRKAGYHGGASLAEMVIPVLVFVPSPAQCPKDWAVYDNPSLHEPAWWNATVDETAPTPAPAAGPKKKGAARPPAQDTALFGPDDLGPGADGPVMESGDGLGGRIVGSAVFAGRRNFVRKAPGDAEIAALIDGLAAAGGKLPVPAVAKLVGQPPFRMAGYLAQVGRLLNVDAYAVIGEADSGRTVELNMQLLKEQFLGAG